MSADYVPVHVYRGCRRHLAPLSALETMVTLCGQGFVATIVGPPASTRPVCSECKRRATLREGTE